MYDFIKHKLKNMGKTQKELADYLNMPAPHLSAIFAGIRLIQATEIVPIAKFLKIDIEDFARYISGEIKEEQIKEARLPEDILNEEEKEIIKALRKAKEVTSKTSDVSQTTKAG